MKRTLIISDLEGVFAPEIWPIIGHKLGLPELSATTRDISDFEQLMDARITALRRHNVKFSEIQTVVSEIKLFKGAENLLSTFSELPNTRCIMITDSFEEFIDLILKKKFEWKVFANRFEVSNDMIDSCVFEIGGHKGHVLKKAMEPMETIIAIGDSFNDIEMLKMARFKVLFNPIMELRGMFKDSIICRNFEELASVINKLA
jgi:phosphoserine/homoserine phosphotransferase